MRTVARVKGGSDHFVLFFASLQLDPGYIYSNKGLKLSESPYLMDAERGRCSRESITHPMWASWGGFKLWLVFFFLSIWTTKNNLIRLAPQSWYLKKCSHKTKAYEILTWNQTQTSFDPLWQSNSVNMFLKPVSIKGGSSVSLCLWSDGEKMMRGTTSRRCRSMIG